jgi:pimeloyl-ACP methyl ester carboxylesterase
MRFGKVLISCGVASALAIGASLFNSRQAVAQTPRPYVVFVNGWQNCCAWGMNDLQNRLIDKMNAEPRYVPYSNFDHKGSSSNTSTDERFLRDGANFINNQLDRNRPLILIGHSFGGDSVLKLLPRINRRIQFVAVIDPVSTGGFRAPLTRDLPVGSNVDYFFNRWQRNQPFPNDYNRDGSIPCNAKTCDQAEQPFYTRTDGTTVTQPCEFFEACRRKNDRTGHQGLPTDDWIEKTIGDKISGVLASFRPPSLASSPSNGIASPSVSSVGQSQIVGLANKCIGVRNGNSESGTPLILWECNGNADQKWSLTSQGSLQGLAGKCIGVRNGNSESGTPLILWECNGNADQRWLLTSQGSLQGLAGKCIGVRNGNSESGTPLLLWECNGNADQRWRISP